MKLVVQRVKEAKVTVDNEIVGKINHGFMILVGISDTDAEEDVKTMVNKLPHLRVFEDEDGKMNRSLIDSNGGVLSISQFTLYADSRKGRRPSFVHAANPDRAQKLYNYFNDLLKNEGIKVETGVFGAEMDVDITNHGPVTILLETVEGKLL